MTNKRTKGRFVKLPYKLAEIGDIWVIAVYVFVAKYPPTYDVTRASILGRFDSVAAQNCARIAIAWLIEHKYLEDVIKDTSKGDVHVYKVVM